MKKWCFLLLFLFFLGFAFMNKALFFQIKVEVQKYDQNHKDNIDNTGTTSIIQKKEIVKEHIYQGNLLLINSKYPMRQVDFTMRWRLIMPYQQVIVNIIQVYHLM